MCLIRALYAYHWTLLKRYYVNTMMSLISVFALFYIVFTVVESASIGMPGFEGAADSVMIGFLVYYLVTTAYSEITWHLVEEAQQGTLEQLAMSRYGLKWLVVMKYSVSVSTHVVIMIALACLMAMVTGHGLQLDLWSAVVLMALTVVGVLGVGLVIGGMALVFKSVKSIFQLVQLSFMILAVTPMTMSGKFMLPIVSGVAMLREVSVSGQTISDMYVVDVMALCFSSLGYFALGLAVFSWCERRARSEGLLGHY